jgi:serine/threonine protein kinase
MTSADLKGQAGEPTKDVSIFGYKARAMGTLYKNVLQALDDYHTETDNRRAPYQSGEVRNALDLVDAAVDSYLRAHRNASERRVAALRALEVDIRAEYEAITAIERSADGSNTWGDEIAAQLKRWRGNAARAPARPQARPRAAANRRFNQDVTLDRALAKGGLGEVWTVRGEGNRLVKKPLKHPDAFRQEYLRQLAVPQHPNVMKVFGVATEGGRPTGALLKFIRGGTLSEALADLMWAYKQRQISARLYAGVIQRVGRDIMEGLAHLHESGVVHADIHAKNVVLGHVHARAKLIDFTAMPVGEEVRLSQAYGGGSPEAYHADPKHYRKGRGKLGQTV